jgi:aldehyde dehydrogenase (NAD+)
VARALAAGARLACGGARLERPGNFHAPTVLTGVTPDMEVATEEVFGPVLAVLEVGSAAEAVEVYNATAYGLSGAVHTRDLGAAQRFADAAESGVVAVNGPTAGIELAAPFGGFGMSGTDSKEHGPESLRFYTRTKLVTWRY